MNLDLKKFFVSCKEYLDVDFTDLEEYIELINTYFPGNQEEINTLAVKDLSDSLGWYEVNILYSLYNVIADKCSNELDLTELFTYGNSFEIRDKKEEKIIREAVNKYKSGSLMNQMLQFIIKDLDNER